MSNLNNRAALDPRWHTWARRTLEAFEACVIAIFDPNSEASGSTFNPYSYGAGSTGFGFGEGGFGEGGFGGTSGGDPGTSVPTRLWTGPAQLQIYRQSLTVDDVAGSVTQLRSVRITAPADGPTMPLRKGLIVRVTSAPLNPDLQNYEITVTSGIASALAWKRTIEGEMDMMVIASPITEYVDG